MRTAMTRSLQVALLALSMGLPAAQGAVVLEKKLASISVSGDASVAAGGKIALTVTADLPGVAPQRRDQRTELSE